MTGCAPTVAQALLAYPQYCSNLYGLNENAGSSTYHSFQFKAEKRFSRGLWILTSYTMSKILTSTGDDLQTPATSWSGAVGVISPFERQRNKSLGVSDVPQVLSASLIYQLPFGQGKRFLDRKGVVDKILGGWQVSSIFRASSAIPFFSAPATVTCLANSLRLVFRRFFPGPIRSPKIKTISIQTGPCSTVQLSSPQTVSTSTMVRDRASRNLTGFWLPESRHRLAQDTRISEGKNPVSRRVLQCMELHRFTPRNAGSYNYSAFNTDVASPSFGMWNGTVSDPRNIQFGLKLLF